jgi:hypothetical protein
MDWIEQVFHVSPDGGNGTIELVVYIVLVAFLASTVLLARARAQRARSRTKH